MAKRLKIEDLTASVVKNVLIYDEDTGHFVWRVRPYKSRAVIGTRAGSRNPVTGYRLIGLGGEVYLEHHLAWLYHFGEHALSDLDHKNGQKDDNRIANLRKATTSENNANRRRHRSNQSGFKGVDLCKGRWRALAKKDGRQHYFGMFSTPEEAHAAYVEGIRRLHGEFARAA